MHWNALQQHLGHLATADQLRVERAFHRGEGIHAGQKRKSGEAFFSHPITVATILADMGADGDTLIAGLLHDSIEDTPMTLEVIEGEFGPAVRILINGVTKLEPKDFADKPTLDDQIETTRKIFTLMQEDVRIMVIKLADRLHNMQTIAALNPERQKTYARETLDIYAKIAGRLGMGDICAEIERLCHAILEPDRTAELMQLRARNKERSKEIIGTLSTELQHSFPTLATSTEFIHELKSWAKLTAQAEAEESAITGVASIAVAIVCESVDICYQMLGALHQLWRREVESFQDFINSPMINGYRGLHTTIILKDGTRVRCKIRTKEMDEYAHRGITTRCFGQQAKGVLDALPWVQRISPLSEDTTARSKEFEESLRSDILGESIVIHGPGDETAELPAGSTALDAAFHLFRDHALFTETILVNGKKVVPYAPLKKADSIDVQSGTVPTVSREWLEWVTTAFATAQIRSALALGAEQDRITIGKTLLQEMLQERRKGFIEEFDPESVLHALASIGFESLEQAYLAIADGRLQPEEVFDALFASKSAPEEKRYIIVETSYSMHDLDTLARSMEVYKKHVQSIHGVRVWPRSPFTPKQGKAKMKMFLTPSEQQAVYREFKSAGIDEVRLYPAHAKQKYVFGVVLLILLWGLDPVFARLLLTSNIHPVDLTVTRFVSFFVASALAYALQRFLSVQKLKPLSPFQPSLFLSGITLFITALFSYVALSHITATQYIIFIIAGLVATSLVNAILRHRPWKHIAGALLVLLASSILLIRTQQTSVTGLLSATISSLGFALYSVISKRYQQEEAAIRTRYPAFMFWISSLCLLLATVLFGLSGYSISSPTDLAKAVAFSLVFAVLPYILYFESMRRMESRFLESALPLVFVSTIVGEMLVTGSLLPLLSAPLLLLFLFQYLRSRREPA